MANYRYFVYVAHPPEELLERKATYNLFAQFGTITKIYIAPEGKEIKVYYENSSEVVNAISALNGVPPHNLRLSNKSEKNLNKFSSNTSIYQPDQNSMPGDDIEARPGDRLFTVHGKSVTTFLSEDGEVFVSVGELKKHGFELFKEKFRPSQISDEEYVSELKSYLSFKARKYLKMFPHNVSRQVVETATIEVVRNFTTTSSPHNNSQRSNKPPNSPNNTIQSPKQNQTINDEKVDGASANNISGLRKPLGIPPLFAPNANSSPKSINNINADANNTSNTPLHKKMPEFAIVDVPLNTPVQICVTHVCTAKICYAYLKSRQSKFTDMLLKVTQEAVGSSAIAPVVGKVCAAQFEGEWYRAIVLQVSPLKISYIDFGNWNEGPVKELRAISDKLAAEPAEAFCVHFGSSAPTKPLKFDDVLTVSAIKQHSDKSYMVRFENSEDMSVRNNNTTGNKAQAVNLNANNFKRSFTNNNSSAIENNLDDGHKENVAKPNKNSFGVNKPNEDVKTTKKIDCKPSTSNNNPTKPVDGKVEESGVRKSSISSARDLLRKTVAQKKTTTLNPERKTVMDVSPPGPGVLQFSDMLKDGRVCFVCPHSAVDGLNILDSIGEETVDDPEYIAKIGESVAVFKEDEDKWVRGTVINTTSDKFTVALIDYGTVESADKVRKLAKQFLDVPEYVCVCSGSKKFNTNPDKDAIDCEVVDINKLKVPYPDGSSEEVACQRWDPFLTSNLAASAEKAEVIVTVRPKNPNFAENELVVLVNFYDGKFFVRSKSCKMALTELQKNIAAYNAVPLKEAPKLNQIVLCPFESGQELHRAAVLKINGKYCDVEYLDLGTVDAVLVDSLKTISEVLAKQELTLAPITLKDFQEEHHTEAAFELIQKYCDDKDKFILQKLPGNLYDLLLNNKESLSKVLQNCGKSDRVLFADLPKPNVDIGLTQLLCVNVERIADDIVTFMPTKGIAEADIDNILNVTSDMSDTNAYMPSLDEICFAEFEGEWYRGRVIETNKEIDQHKILYIDYGNEGVVSSANVRKLMEGFETIPPLGIICKIEDDNGITVSTGDRYNVEILSCVEDTFSVNICEQL